MFYKLYELLWEFNNPSFSYKDQQVMLPVKRAVVSVTLVCSFIIVATTIIYLVLSNR